jgi:hypothetical protein
MGAIGTRRTTLRLLAATAATAAVAAAPAAASAHPAGIRTTEPQNFLIFTVKVAPTGVSFSPEPKAQMGTTGEFKVYNQSKRTIRFELGGRRTKLVKPKAHTIFFLLLSDRGTVVWRAYGTKAPTFKGTFQVY